MMKSLSSVSLDGENIEEKRKEIKEYFHNTFNLFEEIFELLKDDKVFYKKSEPARHQMIFYFGHTAVFFINKLMQMKFIDKRIDSHYESLFEVGVDEMPWDHINTKEFQWPKLKDVREYRSKLKNFIDRFIKNADISLPIEQNSSMWVILMGIEHERIHIETSLVLHRQMDIEFIKKSTKSHIDIDEKIIENSMVDIPEREIKLGKNKNHHLFGWDNEYGNNNKNISKFQTSKYLVSNREFMEFVLDDGYLKTKFWDKEGIDFLQKTSAKHPHFWIKNNNKYQLRTLNETINLPLNHPVEVNALEAEAFCRYKSEKTDKNFQLPSEEEYRSIYEYAGLKDEIVTDKTKANQNLNNLGSNDIDKFSFNGIYDVIGNVFQWSRTPIYPFNGFETHKAYDDFSTPTFDNKHNLILGSSWASSGNIITKHSRYAFRKHFFQNAGFRYVIPSQVDEIKNDIYESDELVSQYCDFQYGDEHFGVKNFALECVKISSSFCSSKTKALDLGCATGRATYELAKTFNEVDGIDFSVKFIKTGVKLKTDGYISFKSKEEGCLVKNKKVYLEDLGYKETVDRVEFYQGDACNLGDKFHSYDLIIATNLIDRLYNPKLFLDNIHKKINKNGILAITSPYTWQESSTNKELWLGGYKDKFQNEIKTIDSLKSILFDNFKQIHIQDLEFVIKESARKYQHTISELSIWKKK